MAKPKSKANTGDAVHSAPLPPTPAAPTPAPEPPVETGDEPLSSMDDPPATVADLQESDDAAVAQDEAERVEQAIAHADDSLDADEHERSGPGETQGEPRHDIDDRELHALIRQCEKQALGHGADADRALLLECASWFRLFLGLGPTDPLTDRPQPHYAPTVNAPAIGHSLPTDSQR